jgi:hypothetical protein
MHLSEGAAKLLNHITTTSKPVQLSSPLYFLLTFCSSIAFSYLFLLFVFTIIWTSPTSVFSFLSYCCCFLSFFFVRPSLLIAIALPGLLFDPEDGGKMLLGNIDVILRNHTELQHRRSFSSQSPLRRPFDSCLFLIHQFHMLHLLFIFTPLIIIFLFVTIILLLLLTSSFHWSSIPLPQNSHFSSRAVHILLC